jgi:hypothetical protein
MQLQHTANVPKAPTEADTAILSPLIAVRDGLNIIALPPSSQVIFPVFKFINSA